MAKPKRKKRKPTGGRPAETTRPDVALEEAEKLRPSLSVDQIGPEWGALQRTLIKAGADATLVSRAIATRDLDLVDRLLANLRDPSVEVEAPEPPADPGIDIPEEVLHDAMRAYRKRLKLTKLDHESKLARSPLSSGKDADFDAIVPPNQFPPEVWRTLAARGELESTGQGFYRIPTARREF